MEWYLRVVKDNYANFNGRARRKEYWMFVLFNMLFVFGVIIIDYLLGTFPILYCIYLLAIVIPSIAVFVRRLHDIGKSGWWFFIGFIPLVGAIWLLVLLCIEGNPGENIYGSSPKAA